MPKARSPIPAELRPEDVVAIVDTREQLPWDLAPLQMEPGSLPTADYSVRGLESHVAIERKSEADYLASCGVERDRFERCTHRLLAYPTRAIVVETTWERLEAGNWRSKITPAAVIGSTLSWITAGIPVVLAGDRERAARYVARILYMAARERWREARALVSGIMEPEASPRSRSAYPPESVAAFDATAPEACQ
jgi:ERCC4-type nuclease